MKSLNDWIEPILENGKWFEKYEFIVSYGVDEKIESIGKKLIFRKFQLCNGSDKISEYDELSDEDKKKALEAVFCDEQGHLILRIPIGNLMNAESIIKSSAKDFITNFKNKKGIALEDLGATLESVGKDKNGKKIRTILGTNYSLFPLNAPIRKRMQIEKREEEKEKNQKDSER